MDTNSDQSDEQKHTPYTKCKVIEFDALTEEQHEFVGIRYRNKLRTTKTVIWVRLKTKFFF